MKGFVFTIIFGLLFFLLLLDASIYVSSREGAAVRQATYGRVDRAGYAMDDFATDFMGVMEFSASSDKLNSSNKTRVAFSDTIPSLLAFPGTEFGQWTEFVENDFSNATNQNITINYTDFQLSPRLLVTPYNLTYGYSSLGKNELYLNGSAQVSNYSILIHLNRDINATDDSGWAWSGSATPLYVSLNITDNEGEQILVKNQTSGYISPSSLDRVVLLGDPSGNLTIEAGSVSGYGNSSLHLVPLGLSARLNTTVLLNGTPEMAITVPMLVTVDEQQSNLILYRG